MRVVLRGGPADGDTFHVEPGTQVIALREPDWRHPRITGGDLVAYRRAGSPTVVYRRDLDVPHPFAGPAVFVYAGIEPAPSVIP